MVKVNVGSKVVFASVSDAIDWVSVIERNAKLNRVKFAGMSRVFTDMEMCQLTIVKKLKDNFVAVIDEHDNNFQLPIGCLYTVGEGRKVCI